MSRLIESGVTGAGEADRLSASCCIAAPAKVIFGLITDPFGHVAIDGSGMLIAPHDATPLGAVGDSFEMDMDGPARGMSELGTYTTTVTATKFVQDSILEWTVGWPGQTPIGHLFGYHLNPQGVATEVTTYCDWSRVDQVWRERIVYPVITVDNLRESLWNLTRLAI